MPELLQYQFEIVGAANVEKALASLERRFAQHNSRINSMFGTRASAGIGTSGAGRALRAAGGGMAGAEAVREQTAMLKKLERERIASEKRVEREKIAAARNAAREDAKIAREQQRQQDYWAKARQRSREREAAETAAAAGARAEFVRSTVGRGFQRTMGIVRGVGAAGLAMTGIGGAALATSAISDATKLDDMARRTSIQGRAAGEQGFDPNELRKRYVQTAIATGISPEQVGAGVGKYVDFTGDIEGGLRHMKTWATLSQASGTSAADLASTTAALRDANITSQGDVAATLSSLYAQGKHGSFKLSDQAAFMPALIGRGKEFGAKGVEGMRQLGGLLQLVQDQTHDPAETATAVKDMFSEFTVKAAKMHSGEAFSGRKVDVFQGGDAKNGARNVRDVIGDVLTASQGNTSQVEDVLGKRGMVAMQGFLNTFKETRLGALKGGASNKDATEKGRQAAMKIWDDAQNVPGDFTTVEKDAADSMKGFGVQLETLETQLKDVVATELFPDLVRLAKELPALIGPVRSVTGVLVRLAETLLEHPFAGLGAILAASIASEVLKAQLGSVFETALGKAVAGQNPLSGMVGGKTNALAAAGTGAAIGISLATAIFTAGVVNFENAEVNMNQAGRDVNRVRDAGLADIDMVREKVQEHRKRLTELENPGVAAAASNVIAYGTTKDETQLKTEQSFLAEMEKRLQALEALKDFGDRIAKAGLSQEEAARRMSEAADKLGVKMPNTGNTPSPVKN